MTYECDGLKVRPTALAAVIPALIVKVLTMLARLRRRLERMALKHRYNRLLVNGRDVLRINDLVDGGCAGEACGQLDSICFQNGTRIGIRDASSAAHTFREIFLEDHYSCGELKRQLHTARIVIDVGANIGQFAYYALRNGPNAQVTAFEADPLTAAVLARNMAALPETERTRVDVQPLALGSRNGTTRFFSSPVSGWSSVFDVLGARDGTRYDVPVRRLSELLHEQNMTRVDYLKVDVEGSEYDILLGDQVLLDRDIRALVVEADRHPRDERYEFEALLHALRQKYERVWMNEKGNSQYPLIYCLQQR